MNQIPIVQNLEPQMKLLRARRQLYVRAKRLMAVQFILGVPVPVLGAVLAIFCPRLRPFVALGALTMPILDIAFLDRAQQRILRQAAKLQEQFDCAVLELPWDTFTAGTTVDPEDVHEAASTYRRRGGTDDELRDWYPVAVATAPLSLARIICQRTNLRYDSKLRRHHGAIVCGAALVVVAALVIFGLAADLPLSDFVVTIMAPASPILIWSIREYFRQLDTADLLDYVRQHAMVLWERAKSQQCDDDECLVEARKLQNAIFTRRAISPLILPLIYRRMRSSLEEQMNEGASYWLQELDSERTHRIADGKAGA